MRLDKISILTPCSKSLAKAHEKMKDTSFCNRHIKALGIVLWVSGLLYLLWFQYKGVLMRGSRPSQSILKLKEMERNGIPDFSMVDVNGDLVTLSQLKDRLVIINFWASWCDPCVDEFPSMVQLIEHFNGKIILLAVSMDGTLEEMKNFLNVFKVSSPYIKVFWDREKVLAQRYGTEALPESYILGPDHQLKKKVVGGERWYTKDSIAFFESLITTVH